MSTKHQPPLVGLCAGKDCRRSREFEALKASLTRCTIVETRCLDICDGPVVILEPNSEDAVILSKLRSTKDVRDLHDVIQRGVRLTSRLKKRRVLGSKRRSALRRAARTFRR